MNTNRCPCQTQAIIKHTKWSSLHLLQKKQKTALLFRLHVQNLSVTCSQIIATPTTGVILVWIVVAVNFYLMHMIGSSVWVNYILIFIYTVHKKLNSFWIIKVKLSRGNCCKIVNGAEGWKWSKQLGVSGLFSFFCSMNQKILLILQCAGAVYSFLLRLTD